MATPVKVKGTKIYLGSAKPATAVLADAVTAASTLFACDELISLGDLFALSRDTKVDDPTLCDSNDTQYEDTDGGLKIGQFTITGYEDTTSAGQALAMTMIKGDMEGTLVVEKKDGQKIWLQVKVVALSHNDLSNDKINYSFTLIARTMPSSV